MVSLDSCPTDSIFPRYFAPPTGLTSLQDFSFDLVAIDIADNINTVISFGDLQT